MRSRRKEPFRFTFSQPISCFFQIAFPEKPISSKGKANIIDLSPEGMKLNSGLNLHIEQNNRLPILIYFDLNNEGFTYFGSIVWQKYKGLSYNYGIKLYVDEHDKANLIRHLKIYARLHVK